MVGRQRSPRRAVRLPVRFRRREEQGKQFVGYTTNVSDKGVFVATRKPLPPGARIELEIERSEREVTLDAVVVHASIYPPQYAHLFTSGMGVRFHRPERPEVREIASLGVALADAGGRRGGPGLADS